MKENPTNQNVVVTGATSGIGLAIAEELLQRNANIIGIGRSPEKCQGCEARFHKLYPQSRVKYLVADLSLQQNIHALVPQITSALQEWGHPYLDALINNAGTFVFWFTQTAEGIETQWAVNHLAPFLLTRQLLPLLQAAPQARVITVSSENHSWTNIHWQDVQMHRTYNGLTAYSQSKLANVLFTVELNHLVGLDSKIRAYAADPGLVSTEIAFKGTPLLARWIWSIRRKGGVTPAQSARGIVAIFDQPLKAYPGAIYWKDGFPKKPAARALDANNATRLWALSAHMCGINNSEINHV